MKKTLGYILIILSIFVQILSLIATPKIMEKYSDNSILVLIVLSIFFYFLAFIYRLGKKWTQKGIKLYLRNDSRDIVLWLRSFKHDNLKISSPRSSFSFFSLEGHFKGVFGATYEEELTKEFIKLGPVVAMDTQDKKTLGAIRDIVNEENWKDIVIERAKSAKFIAILLNNTESLFWEINELSKHTDKDKILYLLPSYTIHEKIYFEESWTAIQHKVSIFSNYKYEYLKKEKIIGFYYEDNNLKELRVEKLTDKKYLNKIETHISGKMTKKDKEIDNIRNSSKKSRIYGIRFFIFMIAPKLFDYDSFILHIDQMILRYVLPLIAWIFLLMSLFESYKTFKSSVEIKKMFPIDIWVGRILNIILFPFFGLLLIAILSLLLSIIN